MRRVVVAAMLALAGAAVAQMERSTPEERAGRLKEMFPVLPEQEPFPDEIGPGSDNAAGRYLWVFGQIRERGLGTINRVDSTRAESLTLNERAVEHGVTVEQVINDLNARADLVKELVRASELDRCAFHLDTRVLPRARSEGDPRDRLDTDCLHATRLLHIDAIRRWSEREREAALRRVASCIRFGNQLAQDRMGLTGAFKANAALELGCASARAFAESADPPLSERERRIVLGALEALDAEDPAGCRRGWDVHRTDAERFIREGVKDDEVSLEAAYLLGGMIQMHPRIIDRAVELWERGVDRETIREEILRSVPAASGEPADMSPTSILAQLAAAHAIGEILADRWADEDEEAFAEAARLSRDDPTGVAMLVLMDPDKIREMQRTVADRVAETRRLYDEPDTP